ncbi:hypothetical protein N9A28_03980 [Sulfurimonas sp.]|nr:hypothetical protein [Sulfurimonas sp.]
MTENSIKNKNAIQTFLEYNGIDPETAMGQDNQLETRYFVGESRKFSDVTRIGFNIIGTNDINVYMYEINHIEFETEFKVTEQTFVFDEEFDTLTITGDNSSKHGAYKIIISSIYLD